MHAICRQRLWSYGFAALGIRISQLIIIIIIIIIII